MRTKAEAIANPEPGDRWEMSYGDQYEITRYDGRDVMDICIKGIDAGQGELSNPISNWLTWAADANYLGGAKDAEK